MAGIEFEPTDLEAAGLGPAGIEYQRIRVLPDGRVRTADAARFLDYSTQTLANWRCSGIGPKWTRRRGRIFYMIEELKTWIAKGE